MSKPRHEREKKALLLTIWSAAIHPRRIVKSLKMLTAIQHYFVCIFICKSCRDLRTYVKKKHLSVVRLQEIFTDTLLLCQETLSVHKSQGLQTLWGHVEGVFPLSLRYLERLNHTEGGKGMKLRSSFDTSERHRLKYAKKPETALKLRKEQLVEDLANSQLCETLKRAW